MRRFRPGSTAWSSTHAWTWRAAAARTRPSRPRRLSNPSPGRARRRTSTRAAQIASSVRAAVSTLPPKFRIAVLLRYFDDLSYEQMADVLGCSMGTVASRLSRGHKMLAERLKHVTSPKG